VELGLRLLALEAAVPDVERGQALEVRGQDLLAVGLQARHPVAALDRGDQGGRVEPRAPSGGHDLLRVLGLRTLQRLEERGLAAGAGGGGVPAGGGAAVAAPVGGGAEGEAAEGAGTAVAVGAAATVAAAEPDGRSAGTETAKPAPDGSGGGPAGPKAAAAGGS